MDCKLTLTTVKVVAFAILLGIVISFIVPISYSHAAISEAEAKELMYQYCEEELGFSKSELEANNFVSKSEGGGWRFSLFVKEPDPATNGFIVGEIAENGNLRMLEPPEAIPLHQQLREAIERAEWDYEAMYFLKQEWLSRIANLSFAEQVILEGNDRNFPAVALMNHSIGLPEDTDISYEQARKNAEDAILAIPGWTQEMLDVMAIWNELYHTPINSDFPVYQFIYGLGSSVGHMRAIQARTAYSFDYDKASREEERVFGESQPYYLSIRINAQTGDVVGNIHIEIPPVSHEAPYSFIFCE